jgi:MFS-type transporter involved in bile tolerance (Atg22 family)
MQAPYEHGGLDDSRYDTQLGPIEGLCTVIVVALPVVVGVALLLNLPPFSSPDDSPTLGRTTGLVAAAIWLIAAVVLVVRLARPRRASGN